MVVKIKKVILKFIGTGINNNYQALVKIYDNCNNLLYCEKTYNGELLLYLKEMSLYKIEAVACGDMIMQSFYVNHCNSKYVFGFNHSIFNKLSTITFLLTDANYEDLPIEKGEMILWQK